MNYIAMCKYFFNATNIPISLMENGNVRYSALGELLSVTPPQYWDIFPSDRNPEFRYLTADVEYGRIQIENTGYEVILGPSFTVNATDELIRQIMRDLMTPIEVREQFAEIMYSIPRISHLQFTQYLSFFHLCLNGKETDAFGMFTEDESSVRARTKRVVRRLADEDKDHQLHNSYNYELELYQHIRNGSVEKLNAFLASKTSNIQEGKMAQTPLRNAKNLFIAIVTKIGMLAAIPGGVNVETTYQLIDFYTQECERMQTIEQISNLQYSMILDFCQRAGEARLPDGISTDVNQCISYIRTHTNEPLSVNDVADHIHRSSSYIMRRFKEELGLPIGAFITRCKLEEAKSLLKYSDASLAAISNYLCFSSQSYFQNVFKKQYGITPMRYRKDSSDS